MSTQKRVLQVSPAYYPAISIGGPIFTNLTFSKALEDINCHIEVVTTTQGLTKTQLEQIQLGKKSISEFSYPIWRFPCYGYPNFTFSPGIFLWLFKHVHRFDLVVLQAVWNFPIMAAYLACKWNNIPYVIIPHGSLYDETFHLKSSKFKRLFFSLYVKKMLMNAHRILFSTQDEALKVKKFLSIPLKYSIVPNIVDVEKFNDLPLKGTFRDKFAISKDQLILTHYGRVTIKKGINFVLNILPEIIQNYPNVVYVIAGIEEDHYINELRTIIQEKQLEKHVIFTGLISPKEGIELLTDSDIFILPSLSENFGMSVVEAMLCEIPVVISEHVGIALDLKNVGCAKEIQLLDSSLKDAINELLNDSNLRLIMGRKGREYARQNYSYQAVEIKLNELIQFNC
ncbi:glycosyltransferase [Aquirufa ecclesiirivi]|uniref:Glycosyltransferase n=1 Tax=Aquirufa ecclesiirivi TaxID=2715124 RepID=A0ABT4JD33_9BACT|nr:glycosyltransferase [Aquirufa ecclesiirivi]MCZ2474197.1 glycosyltransferase [Aquirufa ecclesiirivi]